MRQRSRIAQLIGKNLELIAVVPVEPIISTKPDEPGFILEVRLLLAESQLEDLKNAPRALATLDGIQVPKSERALRLRHGVLKVDALLASSRRDEAQAALKGLQAEFPDNGLGVARARKLSDTATTSP